MKTEVPYVKVPYFDGAEVELYDTLSDDPALVEFLKRGPSDRRNDSRHVFSYYRDFHTHVGGEDWLDDVMGVVHSPEQIWPHVTPKLVSAKKGSDGSQYVVIEADCAWEDEHGLMMVWKEGKYLCKVGGYDGALTNGDTDDDKRINEVYSATDENFTTYVD